ncbi:MAG: Calx-beta domain-containing protein [Gemmatimonadaceae bacterium]
MKRLLSVCLTLFGVASIAAPAAGQPALVINDVSVTESSGGPAVATFTVSFSDGQPHGAAIFFVTTASGQPMGPSVATGGASCSGNVDYVSLNNVGHTMTGASFTFNVTVCGDNHDEADQQFLVNITARGAAVQDGQGVATIIDNDPTPVFSVFDSRITEGADGAVTTGSFTLTLSGATERAPTVSFVGVDGSAISGTCGQGADYEAIPRAVSSPTSLALIPPQSQTQLVLIKICGDNISEGDQQFEIRLSDPTHATIGDASAVVTITDDETLPSISITPSVQVSEPNALQPVSEAVFSVTYVGPATEQPVVVNYATSAGTATAGTACASGGTNGHTGDFVSQRGTLNFSPGKKVQQIRVPICADSVGNEPNESFSVTLARATNARITQGVGTATIR